MHTLTSLRARWCGLLALSLFAVTTAGCAKYGKVSGKVTYVDGKPLPAGRITFIKEGSKDSKDTKITDIDSDGMYKINATIGTCKVILETNYILELGGGSSGGKTVPGAPGGAGGGDGGMKMPEDMKKKMGDNISKLEDLEKQQKELEAKKAAHRYLPPEYKEVDKTPLKTDIHKGDNTFDIELKGTPEKPSKGIGPR